MSERASEAAGPAASEPTLPDTRRREVIRQAWSVGIASGTSTDWFHPAEPQL